MGALLSCLVWNVYFMKKPLAGEPVNFAGFCSEPASGHALGLLGGVVWGVGMVSNLVAANFTGVAISYAIGQSAPMVAALWGVFVWKEFAGATGKAKMTFSSCLSSTASRFPGWRAPTVDSSLLGVSMRNHECAAHWRVRIRGKMFARKQEENKTHEFPAGCCSRRHHPRAARSFLLSCATASSVRNAD